MISAGSCGRWTRWATAGAYMMELYRQNYDEFARLRESVDRLQDIADSLGIR